MTKGKHKKISEEKSGVCPKCEGAEFILTPEGAVPCDCRYRTIVNILTQNARIPSMFLNKSLSTFETKLEGRKDVITSAKNFIDHYQRGGRGLLIIGDVGVGKTHIAVSILKELISKGYSGLYYNVIDLLRVIRSSYSNDTNFTENDILEITSNVDMLVLDDLGAENTSGWVLDRLYSIINKRYEEGKTIIVTTNCKTHDDLVGRVGDRIASRLAEVCIKFEFPEGDYRTIRWD